MLQMQGRRVRACQGMTRRTMLQAAGSGLLGLNVPHLLAAEESTSSPPATGGRAKSVIFLFLFGGPSQFETFDMKPLAPSEIRGPFQPIRSKTPGLMICEHLPKLAAISDKYCVLRAMSHDFNDHSGAGHYVQTGKKWQVPVGGGFSATPDDWPSVGSVVEYFCQRQPGGLAAELPSYMVVPNRLGRLQDNGQYVRPGEYAGWLGRAYNPLATRVDKRTHDDNPYWRACMDSELAFNIEGLDPPTVVELDRIKSRAGLLSQFDAQRRIIDAREGLELDRLRQRALSLATSSKTRAALDLRQEPTALRDRYGRHLFGQSCLLARRLVEAGTRYVTVHYDACDGYSWDSHIHSRDVKNHLLPTFDDALSALLTDLDDRGMLEETLVVALGEMGRTPKPTPTWGRGHWSQLFPAVLAGGGVAGGQVYGSSDKNGAEPVEGVTSPEDLAATLYAALGINPHHQIVMPDGRPVPLVDGGQPIRTILGA